MTELILPYPVSANRYWRSFVHPKTGIVVRPLSREAKAYKQEVGWIARQAGFKNPTEKPIELRLTLIPKNGIIMDLSNCLKISEDALQGIVYKNDHQVKKISLEYADPDGKGGLIVRVSEFIPETALIFERGGMCV